MLVIADEERPIGLAGIMGGASTEVTDDDPRVILESASSTGRRSATRPAVSASAPRRACATRRDRPRPPALCSRPRRAPHRRDHRRACRAWHRRQRSATPTPRAAGAVDLRGCSRCSGIELDAGRRPGPPRADWVRRRRRRRPDRGRRAVPHRLDVIVAADVAEEVARAHGYERIEGGCRRPPCRRSAVPAEPRTPCAGSSPGSGSTRSSGTRSSAPTT